MPRKLRRRREADSIVRVKVIKRKGKDCFVLRWRDRTTGRIREQSSTVEAVRGRRRLAEREAAELEERLTDAADETGGILWTDFETKYKEEYLSGLAVNTQTAWLTAKTHLIKHINPHRLADVDGSALSRLQGELRKTGIAETSIASYLRQIHAALWWATRADLIAAAPKMPSPPRAKGKTKTMRSRPLLGEEFERMLLSVSHVRPHDAAKFERLLNGLWLSGLRLNESLELSWDWGSPFAVCMAGKYPMFRIQSEAEKAHSDRLLPIAPEFCRMLSETPPSKQRGSVFGIRMTVETVGRIISEIGAHAGIVVGSEGKTATAHDLRRSFGSRWAGRVAPAELKELMRHRSIETTMKYYVRLNADQLAQKLHEGEMGDLSGDHGQRRSPALQNSDDTNQVVKEL